MIAQQIAIYALIAFGLGAGAAFVLLMLRKGKAASEMPKWRPLLLGGIAFGALGVGGYGPSFLSDYSKFLKDIASLQGEAQDERYEKFVNDMGSGKMPEKFQPLVRAYMLEHPTANMETAIEQGISTAKPENREELSRMKIDLQRKRDTAQLAAKAAIEASPASGTHPLEALDSTSVLLLSRRTEAELKAMKIDPATIEALARSRRAGMHRLGNP